MGIFVQMMGAGLRRRTTEGCIDRRNIPEGASHGFEPAGKKEGPDDKHFRLMGRKKGGLNTKLHVVTDAVLCPMRFLMTAGQVSDDIDVAALLSSLLAAEWLIADWLRGY